MVTEPYFFFWTELRRLINQCDNFPLCFNLIYRWCSKGWKFFKAQTVNVADNESFPFYTEGLNETAPSDDNVLILLTFISEWPDSCLYGIQVCLSFSSGGSERLLIVLFVVWTESFCCTRRILRICLSGWFTVRCTVKCLLCGLLCFHIISSVKLAHTETWSGHKRVYVQQIVQ